MADRNSGPGRSYWLDAKRHELAQSRARGVEEVNAGLPAGMTSARVESTERPWYHSGNDPMRLAGLNQAQKADYILEGKL